MNVRPLILHFDDIYFYQKILRSIGKEVDLRGISGVRYLCSMEKLYELEDKIPNYGKSITFIGSGDFHYVTYILLRRINEYFNLLLIDNHLDIRETFDGFISCGSWLKDALNLKYLGYVFYIGSDTIEGSDRIIRIGENLKQLPFLKKVESPIYISVDKDIINNSFLETNWEQGCLSVDNLLEILSYISAFNIIGIDICGEPRPNPFDPSIRRSEEINLKLINLFYEKEDKRILA
ncbi:MAG: hypothetical protein ACP5K2_05570 [bacterium]